MTEYLKKKAVLEWLKQEQRDEGWLDQTKHGFFWVEREIESGAFDADDSEAQRLRVALERIKKWADDPKPVTMLKIRNLANETLKGEENA